MIKQAEQINQKKEKQVFCTSLKNIKSQIQTRRVIEEGRPKLR